MIAKLQTNAVSCTATFTQMARASRRCAATTPASTRWWRSSSAGATRSWTACARSPASSARGRKGAFYVFPNITGTGFPAKPLADRLLDEAGVACLSGTAFGECGEGHLRFSYANSLENIQEALRRIRACLAS